MKHVDGAYTHSLLFPASRGGDLNGERDNGLVSFGRLPAGLAELCNRAIGARAIRWRPLLRSLSFHSIPDDTTPLPSTCEVIVAFTSAVLRGTTQRATSIVYRDPGTAIHTLFATDLWVPVDSDNGAPFDMRIWTTGKAGDWMLTYDYEWARSSGDGSDGLVRAS